MADRTGLTPLATKSCETVRGEEIAAAVLGEMRQRCCARVAGGELASDIEREAVAPINHISDTEACPPKHVGRELHNPATSAHFLEYPLTAASNSLLRFAVVSRTFQHAPQLGARRGDVPHARDPAPM